MSLRRLLEAWRGPQSLERERPVEAPENAPDYVDSRDCGLVDAVQSGWYQSETDELFKGFPVGADDVVLDVGCGAGGATLFCANRGARVIFSDVVEEKIEALRQRVASTPARDAQGIVSDSCPLPLEDALATRVIALEMLEHVDDPAQVLAEAGPGGAARGSLSACRAGCGWRASAEKVRTVLLLLGAEPCAHFRARAVRRVGQGVGIGGTPTVDLRFLLDLVDVHLLDLRAGNRCRVGGRLPRRGTAAVSAIAQRLGEAVASIAQDA